VVARVTVLGSTGSIGQSTLDVLARHPDKFVVHALSAYSRIELLVGQARATAASVVVVPTDAAAQEFRRLWGAGAPPPELRVGQKALAETAGDDQSQIVMAAIVGAAGLPAAFAAAQAGKRVLLANKEALVAAGSLFMAAVQANGAELLPIDSEHNAIFQCLPHHGRARAPTQSPAGVRRLILTASGGPFRARQWSDLHAVTPDEACAHPNWSMGRKISVDSATMLNKGLEVIEAHWLFAMPPEQISVVIHPQSVVHSMVEYEDGSVVAQLGQPDMRTPIAYGLGFPERIASGVGMLDLAAAGRLDFSEPDLAQFPCLRLSFEALRSGQVACIALNAANEIAVEAFLSNKLTYTRIPAVIEGVLAQMCLSKDVAISTIDDVIILDLEARRHAHQIVSSYTP
jgi:1-deoxy-D-xylulose-5-phosphate reductoisomerase